MKLKLTFAEFTVLYNLLQDICIGIKPKGIQQQILHGVLFRIFKKFYNKALVVKNKYSIILEADECCAFYTFFMKYDMAGQEPFTVALVHKINNSVHQKYSA